MGGRCRVGGGQGEQENKSEARRTQGREGESRARQGRAGHNHRRDTDGTVPGGGTT